ncbi:MAG TPA: orotidine-5'-phosphate decarboxylase [Thermodesulforhabdus norvegica]|uniref:Orotidine 5'-phosphate decarboxylase n=1 Tax=Thermodesulforhabdus norvegica TaxID=39841 RepID=A0A7C0WW84_9BACT|nr:orotidine-5'-phosphate decarboxylase [Deltaproteobacteria bacterium]MBW2069328.1 orotidine-5'-phosphate decarboxylase [Deltaproteobacteria bacterium]HDL90666.1 orotidine-5'-phosphate decarboxylase [Thermodesulforhabdus norvegica]
MKKNIPLEDRIIFALDIPTVDEAKEWVKRLDNVIRFYKVGLQLFLSGWFHIVDWIVDRGNKVMLDLKFFDVPNTVARAVEQLHGRGVYFATIHGNDSIIRAAVENKGDVRLLAVTVLTAFDDNDVRDMLGNRSIMVKDVVYSRVRRAIKLGCDGIVSSGLEVPQLRREFGNSFIVVTPGVRPGREKVMAGDDQKRIVTPGEAISNGADYIVVGRPIRAARDPLAVVLEMQQEIAEVVG